MITIVVCFCVHFYNYDIFIDFAQTKWQSLTTRGKTLKSCSLCLSRATTSWLPQRPSRLNYEKLKWSSGLPWIFSSTQNYSSKRALSFVTIVKWISFWLKLNKKYSGFYSILCSALASVKDWLWFHTYLFQTLIDHFCRVLNLNMTETISGARVRQQPNLIVNMRNMDPKNWQTQVAFSSEIFPFMRILSLLCLGHEIMITEYLLNL